MLLNCIYIKLQGKETYEQIKICSCLVKSSLKETLNLICTKVNLIANETQS